MLGKSDRGDPLILALTSLKNDIDSLKREQAHIKSQINTLSKKNPGEELEKKLSERLDLMEDRLNRLEAEITNLRSSVIPALSREIEKFRKELEEAKKGKQVQLVILPKDEAKRLIDELIG